MVFFQKDDINSLAFKRQQHFICHCSQKLTCGYNLRPNIPIQHKEYKCQNTQISYQVNFPDPLQGSEHLRKGKKLVFVLHISQLKLRNQLIPLFPLLLKKSSIIILCLSCIAVIFCPKMYQKCWFLFLASGTYSTIMVSNIGQITKSRTFSKSTLNGL